MVKTLILLGVLMTASGLSGESVNQTATGGIPGEWLRARLVREYGVDQIHERDDKNAGEEKLLRAGAANEVEVKRLKLVFLLIMSLSHYRTPIR